METFPGRVPESDEELAGLLRRQKIGVLLPVAHAHTYDLASGVDTFERR